MRKSSTVLNDGQRLFKNDLVFFHIINSSSDFYKKNHKNKMIFIYNFYKSRCRNARYNMEMEMFLKETLLRQLYSFSTDSKHRVSSKGKELIKNWLRVYSTQKQYQKKMISYPKYNVLHSFYPYWYVYTYVKCQQFL